MSYRIEKNEPLSNALGRIAAEEIALALAELHRPNRAQAMHNTRKSLKRLRSLMRSLGVAFPKQLFRRENRRLAAAGRKIAPLRDLHVQLRALGKLRAHNPAAKKIEGSLLRRQKAGARRIPALRRAVRQMLSASRDSFAALRLQKATPEDLVAGLRRVYKHGREALKAARRNASPENLHEWRKGAKILGHGLELINRIGPEYVRIMMNRADRLCEALGDDHDLFMVLGVLRREDAARPARDYRRLAKLIAAKRGRLQVKAFKLGKKIYDEKPGKFGARLQGWLCRKPSKQ